MWARDWPQGFLPATSQVSATVTYPGVVKAFHYHLQQYDCWTVVSGMLQVAWSICGSGSRDVRAAQHALHRRARPWQVLIPAGRRTRLQGDRERVRGPRLRDQPVLRSRPTSCRIPYDDEPAQLRLGDAVQMKLLVTGGAGFHRFGVRATMCCRSWPDAHIVTLDKLTYAGNLENLRRGRRRPAPPVRSRGHLRRDRGRVDARDESHRRDRPLRGGVARRPQHPFSRSVHRDQHPRHGHAARRGADGQDRPRFCSSRPTKCTATSTRRSKPTRRFR